MDYEQKYKKALERAQQAVDKGQVSQNFVDDIFPELQENDDERIRKWCISHFNACINVIKDNDEYKEYLSNKVIAWLEKQGEKKPADKITPKFKVGDFIINDYCLGKVIVITNDAYLLDTGQGIPFSREHNAHLWTINDAKDGDVLMTTKTRNCPFIYRKTDYNNNLAYYYAGVDGNGDFCEGCLKRTMFHFGSVADITPATKEQRDLLFKKMKEAGYEWDADKKELKKIEVVSKESEDERIRKTLIEHIKGIKSWNYFLGISKEQMIAWLEKQGEKKLIENVETKFCEGDKVVSNQDERFIPLELRIGLMVIIFVCMVLMEITNGPMKMI